MIAERLTQVRENIDAAIAGRAFYGTPDAVKLVAVTKNHDTAAMREAIDAGVRAIGENRLQEATQKAEVLERDVEWHLIGHLQTNKVKSAVALFDLIHSVDSKKLAAAIDRDAKAIHKVQDILLQVNIAREESKYGIRRDEALDFVQFAAGLSHVRLCGLMAIAPYSDDPELARPFFKEMFSLFTKLKAMEIARPEFKWLSMGMSNDYRIAVEEGANIVRIGTGIFGQRQY